MRSDAILRAALGAILWVGLIALAAGPAGAQTPFGWPGLAQSQLAPSPEPPAEPPADKPAAERAPERDPMAEMIRRARENGSVIIVAPNENGRSWDYRAVGGERRGPLAEGDPGEAYNQLAGDAPMRVLDRTQTGVAAFYEKLGQKIEAAPGAWPAILATLTEASPTGDPWYFLWVFLIVSVGLMAGWVVEKFYYGIRLVGPWFIAQQVEHPRGYVEKLPILALRIALTAGGIAISITVALLLGLIFYEPHPATQKTALVILANYALVRIVSGIWRMIFAPYLPNYRIPCLDDRQARILYQWMFVSSTIAFSAMAICLWLAALGLPSEIHALLTSGATLLTVLINLTLIRANQSAVSYAILGGCTGERASVLARIGAALWAPLASLYLIIAWAEMTYRLVMDQPLGLPLVVGAYVILTSLLVSYGGIAYLIEWVFQRRRRPPPPAEGALLGADGAPVPADDGDPAMTPMFAPTGYRMRTMEDLARRIASIFALGAGVFAVLSIWDANVVLAADGALGWFIDIGVTLLIGYISYHAARIAIDRKIEEEGGADVIIEPGDEGGGAAASSRLATLLPLFRNFLLVTIAIVTIMMLLLESGVNVTPLFAGAGVVGLAIGFGAQTLVRDIFSGAFFLIDDAFRKGEYIDIGEVKGTVEKISVRSFQLRHHLGYLHTIPFGEVQYLTNYSRDWVMMKLPLRLTYDTDVEKVRKLIKKLGQELMQDPEIGDKFLQPLKSQGVYQMEESAMIIRVKFMTRPGEQWVIRKKVYSAIRELFEREGIRFAHREVTVHLAGEGAKDLSEADKTQIAGAVRPILDPPEGVRAPAMAGGDDR